MCFRTIWLTKDQCLLEMNDQHRDVSSPNTLTVGFGLFREAYAMAMLGVVNAHHKRAFGDSLNIIHYQRTVTDQQPCHLLLLP